MTSGFLVAFEGIDGAGKSTQIQAVAQHFRDRGWRVVTTREPTDGPHGRAIRQTAHTGRLPVEQELELFERDRREHVETLIAPELERGSLVLVDRYYFSTAAYQGIRGLDPADIIARNEAFAPRPDVLVILELPLDVALSRVHTRGEGGDGFERREDLRRVAEIFGSLRGDWIVRIDADRDAASITDDIVSALGPAIEAPNGHEG